MVHPMAEQWMRWMPIDDAPMHGKSILVGFQGQFEWVAYVANAFGKDTGKGMPFASPTHWTPIIPPEHVHQPENRL